MITRKEGINLRLSAIITKKNKEFLIKQGAILGFYNAYRKGEQLNISYNFNIDYLNDINKRFEAILAIAKRKDVQITSASVASYTHSKILINEILRKIEELELKTREGALAGGTWQE